MTIKLVLKISLLHINITVSGFTALGFIENVGVHVEISSVLFLTQVTAVGLVVKCDLESRGTLGFPPVFMHGKGYTHARHTRKFKIGPLRNT
jgi:hypothetical protein